MPRAGSGHLVDLLPSWLGFLALGFCLGALGGRWFPKAESAPLPLLSTVVGDLLSTLSDSAPSHFVPFRRRRESQGFWQAWQPKSQVASTRSGVRRSTTFCLLSTLRGGLQSPNTTHQPCVGRPALICRWVSARGRDVVGGYLREKVPDPHLARKGIGSNFSEGPVQLARPSRHDWSVI